MQTKPKKRSIIENVWKKDQSRSIDINQLIDEKKEEIKLVTNYSQNNYIMLVGKITSEKKFSHEIYGESFFNFDLEIPRLSGISDIIPITISERLIANFDLSLGKQVVIEGQFRSYNTYEDSKSRLILTVFVKEITEKVEDEEIIVPNEVQI